MAKLSSIILILLLLVSGCSIGRHYVRDIQNLKVYTIDLDLIEDYNTRVQVNQLLSDFGVTQELIFTYQVREKLLESRIVIMADIIKECSSK